MEFEPLDELERELRQAFKRQQAPLSLKRKIMARSSSAAKPQSHAVLWQRLAATLALAAVLSGAAVLHHREEQRKGEAARQQVLTALRITNRALEHMNKQLTAHHRASHE